MRIINITNRGTGETRTDKWYQDVIGKEATLFSEPRLGCPLHIIIGGKAIQTSLVVCVVKKDGKLKVVTSNSVYYFDDSDEKEAGKALKGDGDK